MPNASGENYLQTMRSGDAPPVDCASPLCHRKPLNYSVSLKYWYKNHSWLNWRRPAAGKRNGKGGSQDLLASFLKPPLPLDWWLLMAGSCSPLFNVHLTQDALNAEERLPGQWLSYWQRKKNILSKYKHWLSSVKVSGCTEMSLPYVPGNAAYLNIRRTHVDL